MKLFVGTRPLLLATAALLCCPSQVQSWGASSGSHAAAAASGTSVGGSSNSRTPAPPPAPDTCCEGGATGYNASLLSVPATCPPPPSDASNQSYNALWPPLNASYRGNNAWRTAGYITCPASAPKCTRLRCTALGGGTPLIALTQRCGAFANAVIQDLAAYAVCKDMYYVDNGVWDSAESSTGMDVSTIVGIVIGVCFGIAFIVFCAYVAYSADKLDKKTKQILNPSPVLKARSDIAYISVRI